MNRVFALLLDVGYASGGGLLKFGGDALLLFFNGPDHAGRAVRRRLRHEARASPTSVRSRPPPVP